MSKGNAEIEQWDRYWAYGNIHSFSQVAGGNYQGRIAAFWQDCFRAIEPGSRILDIATGNGAIPLLALAESDRLSLDFDITGVDLADIDPAQGVKDPSLQSALARITFRGRTPAESLPCDDLSVDLVCSQFGLEYSDLGRSIPEIARVLKPAGRLAVIAHHCDSVLLRATRVELEQLDFVLDEVKLYLRARNLLRAMPAGSPGGAGRANPKLQKKHKALQDAMTRVQQAAEQSTNPTMLLGPAQYVREIFSAMDRASPGELLKWLEEALSRVTANRRRLMDMEDAALGEDDMEGLVDTMNQSGISDLVALPFYEEDGSLLGWCLEARGVS